jgi:hypothetical protein
VAHSTNGVDHQNFHIAEDAKRKQQVEAYIQRTEPVSAHVSWIERLNPYRLLRAKPKSVNVSNLPIDLALPLQKAVLREDNLESIKAVSYMLRSV